MNTLLPSKLCKPISIDTPTTFNYTSAQIPEKGINLSATTALKIEAAQKFARSNAHSI